MTLILDAGALVGYERRSRTVRAFLERAQRSGVEVRTTTGAVAQVWRDGSRQVRLAMLVRGLDEVELTAGRSRLIGVLLGRAGHTDVVDGSVVDVAADGDEILTSDPDDIAALVAASGKTVIVTHI